MLVVGMPDTSFSRAKKPRSSLCFLAWSSNSFTASSVRPHTCTSLGSWVDCDSILDGDEMLDTGGFKITCTLDPPKPKEFMPTMPPLVGIGLVTTWTRPSASAGMSGLGWWKWIFGAHVPCSRDKTTYSKCTMRNTQFSSEKQTYKCHD